MHVTNVLCLFFLFCSNNTAVGNYTLFFLNTLQVHAIRKLCKECGIDSRGSKMELILRLREEMATRSKYDKVFQKVWCASGKLK